MTANLSEETAASRAGIAALAGLPTDVVTDAVLARIADDPLFLHHLQICRNDPTMLSLLLAEVPAPAVRPGSPGNAELVARAGAALARWAGSGFRRVGPDVHERRLDACRGCEHLTAPGGRLVHRLLGTDAAAPSVCGLCGCDVARKAWLGTEHCPDGRWPE